MRAQRRSVRRNLACLQETERDQADGAWLDDDLGCTTRYGTPIKPQADSLAGMSGSAPHAMRLPKELIISTAPTLEFEVYQVTVGDC